MYIMLYMLHIRLAAITLAVMGFFTCACSRSEAPAQAAASPAVLPSADDPFAVRMSQVEKVSEPQAMRTLSKAEKRKEVEAKLRELNIR